MLQWEEKRVEHSHTWWCSSGPDDDCKQGLEGRVRRWVSRFLSTFQAVKGCFMPTKGRSTLWRPWVKVGLLVP